MRFGLFAAKQTHVEEDEEVVDLEAEEETVV
jgi:hypothetical protein